MGNLSAQKNLSAQLTDLRVSTHGEDVTPPADFKTAIGNLQVSRCIAALASQIIANLPQTLHLMTVYFF